MRRASASSNDSLEWRDVGAQPGSRQDDAANAKGQEWLNPASLQAAELCPRKVNLQSLESKIFPHSTKEIYMANLYRIL